MPLQGGEVKSRSRKKIGIFGGTFNPIHYGHLLMAGAAKKEFKLSYVYFIPCGIPPHKRKEKLLPAKLRYEMTKKAIKGKKYFKILDIEIKKKKPSYTIDTILSLQKAIKHGRSNLSKNTRLYFLIGADEFEKLSTWTRPNELAKLVQFLVLPRPDKNIKTPKIKNLNWNLIHTKPINISSSDIRKRIKQGESIKNLVPPSVLPMLL